MSHPAAPVQPASSWRLVRRAAASVVTRLGGGATDDFPIRDQIRAQQIDLLFRTVAAGVIGAGLADLTLAMALRFFHAVGALKSEMWAAYIVAGMALHLALLAAYRRSGAVRGSWRGWALAFSLVTFTEGVGWGWAPLYLVDPGNDDMQLLVACVTMVVATAAVPAFGYYMPAFFTLFLPAALPFTFASLFMQAPALRFASYLMPIYDVTVIVLAVQTSLKYKELVALRLKSAALAEGLRSQVEFVEQAMIAKSNFLSAASHDLRQPVHAIALFAGALRAQAMPEPAQRLAGQIEDAVTALDGLFAALLDISRLDAGSVEVRPSEFTLKPLLSRLVEDFRADIAAEPIRIDCVGGATTVRADPVLLERVLRNLVSNAVRYTVRGRVLIGCRRRGASVEVQVHDTGVGIAPEHIGPIFKEYFQVGNPERDRRKGLGLGLAIVDRLVRLQGLELQVRSQIGRGSCFSLRIPLSVGAGRAPAAARPTNRRGVGLVVVIDDEGPILTGMRTLLNGWGYNVVAAESGSAAVEALAQQPVRPDLVITDYWLRGGETGFDVMEKLNVEYNEEIPAILISGDTGRDVKLQAEAVGALILHKPASPARLRASIDALIARARQVSG